MNNLQGIDLEIPLRRLVALAGVGGSGKSSLAFQTLHAESTRRYIESLSSTARVRVDRLEPPQADWIGQLPPAVALRQIAVRPSRRATLAGAAELAEPLRHLFARAATPVCPDCRRAVQRHAPSDAAAELMRLPPGTRVQIGFALRAPRWRDLPWQRVARELASAGFSRALIDGATVALGSGPAGERPLDETACVVVDRLVMSSASPSRLEESIETSYAWGDDRCRAFIECSGRNGNPPGAAVLARVDGRAVEVRDFANRLVCLGCQFEFPEPEAALFNFNSSLGACPGCRGLGQIRQPARPAAHASNRKTASWARVPQVCPQCQGGRLRREAAWFHLAGWSLPALLALSASQARDLLRREIAPIVAQRGSSPAALLDNCLARLGALLAVALGGVALDRPLHTLSAGERLRARLAAAQSAGLADALYLLEYPTAGLHPDEIEPLLGVLTSLRDAGNSLLVVDHHPAVLQNADWIIELGPGSGREGGNVTFQGDARQYQQRGECGPPGSGRAPSAGGARRRSPAGWIAIHGICFRQARGLTIRFPLGVLCAVAGVAGSGKRSLVEGTLVPALAAELALRGADAQAQPVGAHWQRVEGASALGAVLPIDGAPLGRAGSASLAARLGLLPEIRRRFVQTNDAAARGYGPGHFSTTGCGRCETCQGRGQILIDMHFLPDVATVCPDCRGLRFRPEILEVRYRGLSIAEVLALPAREAFAFFRGATRLQRRLRPLVDVGLDAVPLGRPVGTLSASESSRLKLALHLGQRPRRSALFVLSEPAAGMHPLEVQRLLSCLGQLLAEGHSVVMIDHHLEVLRNADYLLELGRAADGAALGVVVEGTPEQVAANPSSLIARHLAEHRGG